MSVRLDHGEDVLAEVHEINVTPFIDVMLVLLIIFMVAAPLATVDIAVNLPASTAQPQPRPDKPLFLTVKPDLSLALGDQPVPRDQLRTSLDAMANGDKETHLPPCRQSRAVWRRHGSDEHPARRRLPQDRAGRTRKNDPMIGFSAEDRRDLARWIICGIVVVLVHVGAAAAVVQWRDPVDTDDPDSAMVVDLAPVPVSSIAEQTDMPIGPQQVQSEYQPEQKIEEKQEEKVVAELAPDPDIAVSPPVPEPKPEPPKPPEELSPPVPATTMPEAVQRLELASVPTAPTIGRPNNSNASRPGRIRSSASLNATSAIRRKRRSVTSRASRSLPSASIGRARGCRAASCRAPAPPRSTPRLSNWCAARSPSRLRPRNLPAHRSR